MKCSVFIACSADGYIATDEGDVDWLETAGKKDVDLGDDADMGFAHYMASVDCMIIGRKTMEKIASFNLAPEQWPYGRTRIIALSHTLREVPGSLQGKVEIYSGAIGVLISRLEEAGFKHAYVDGGSTITAFINLGLVDEMTITLAPVLLGSGIPLFGRIDKPIVLENAQATVYPNDFITIRYQVRYPEEA